LFLSSTPSGIKKSSIYNKLIAKRELYPNYFFIVLLSQAELVLINFVFFDCFTRITCGIIKYGKNERN